jgi:L-threonylcarbamoyladenylate synthase
MQAAKLEFETITRRYSATAIIEAAQWIKAGYPVAIPTETVYGLAGDATNDRAVAAIYAAKGRPQFNPLIIHVCDKAAAEQIAHFSDQARQLADDHWPGPLTLVLPLRQSSAISRLACAGLPTVAIRVPAHRAIRALILASGTPLAAPSANPSGLISPTRAQHVAAGMAGRIPMIIDDGPCERGIESTIATINGEKLTLLRPGPIDLGLDQNITQNITAPGQMMSHYAPRKPLRCNVTHADSDEWHIGFGPVSGNFTLSANGDLVEAASQLFDALHQGDAAPYARIAIAPIPDIGLGMAINDRINRAVA